MQITTTTSDILKIKSKSGEYTIGSGKISIGSREISQVGEYDVFGVQIEVELSATGPVFLIRDEDLLITYVSNVDDQVSKVEQVSDTSILLLDLRSDTPIDQASKLIKALEPAYVFLMGAGASETSAKILGLPVNESSTLKVTRTSLPIEGTEVIPTW